MPIPNAEQKGRILKRLLDNAIKARAPFMKTGKEIERYGYARDFNFEYTAASEELFFKAKVAKTAQFIDIVGSALYQTNPDRRVNPRPWVNEQQRARGVLMQQYLNYTPGMCDLYGHSRRAIIEGLMYGRGVLWTGWNDRKKCIQSVHDTIDNLLVDPDAKILEEMGWVARRRVRPRVELLSKFKDPDAQKAIKKITAQVEKSSDADATGMDWERSDYGSDQIEFYECYFRNGLSRYKGGVDLTSGGSADIPDSEEAERKYYVTRAGDLFAEEDWEIPFFKADEWPCTPLDFRERPGSIWPVSPLEPGLGHQKALNWLYTLYLSKARITTRTLVAVATQNGQGLDLKATHKALYGKALEFITLNVNGDAARIDQFIQQFDFKLNVEEFVALNQIINHEFEQATGLTEFLATGFGATQARSAEEVKIKDTKSRTRIEDYRAIMEKWASKVARKEALAARYLCDPEDLTPIFGQQIAQTWGQLMPSIAMQMEMAKAGKIRLTDIMQPGPNDVIFDEWVHEADYEIAAGSLRRKDIDQAIDAADAAMNQLVPALISEGASGPASAIIADWAEKKGLSPSVGQSIQQWAQTEAQAQQIKSQIELETLQMQNAQAQMQLAQMQMQAQQPQMATAAQPQQPQPQPQGL